ncbi:MAG: F0F1 ATP synthase subunit epsilon [Acidobacteria bacterium]|nr:F0F1 ATP synthase subunit epsilon [Acidobacteriota bacterium]
MTVAKLHLKVVTPTRVVVEADVDEVTLPGALGALGILPGHAPLLCALRIGELGYRQGSREHYLALQWGFAEVAADDVTVLADVAELPAEIDVEAARADKLSAEDALRAASGEEFEQQRAQLESAVTRIAVATRR